MKMGGKSRRVFKGGVGGKGMGMELINTYYVHVWILNKIIKNRKITVTIFYHLRKISQSSTQKPSEEFIYVNPYQYISIHINTHPYAYHQVEDLSSDANTLCLWTQSSCLSEYPGGH